MSSGSPVVCPECNTIYKDVHLDPGAHFLCGSCGHEMVLPTPVEDLEDLGSLELIPDEPAPPVVQPRGAPDAGPGKPVGTRVPSRPAPAVQPHRMPATPKPVARKAPSPAPVIQPKKAAAPPKPAGAPRASASAQRKAAPSRSGAAAPERRAAPAGSSATPIPRKVPVAVGREVTEVFQERATKDRQRRLVVYGSLAGLAVVAAAFAAYFILRTDPLDRERSYVAGYRAMVDNALVRSLKLRSKTDEQMWEEFSKSYLKEPVRLDFDRGLSDAMTNIPPQYGSEEIEAQKFPVERYLELVAKAFPVDTADGAFRAAQKVREQKDRWERKGASKAASGALHRRSVELATSVLKLDPDHAETRDLRGEKKYENELAEYLEADYLNDPQKATADRAHRKLLGMAEKNDGWVDASDLAIIETIRSEFGEVERKYKNMMTSPFYAKADQMRTEVSKELEEVFNRIESIWDQLKEQLPPQVIRGMEKQLGKKRTFTVRIREPYVVFVEEDPGWDPSRMADETVLKPLTSLNRKFLEEYQARYELKNLEEPVPLVLLRNNDSYQAYNLGKNGRMAPGALAHFEPDSGRLVLHGEGDFTTTLHEGTHQLMFYYIETKQEFLAQSFWFHEGVAEWFSGAKRDVDPETGDWRYELGLIQEGRLQGLRRVWKDPKRKHYGLKELLDLTFASRNEAMKNREMWKVPLVYSQGWLLIYFFNNFDVDGEGVIKIATPDSPVRGRYADSWDRYLRYELKGKDGKPYSGKEAFKDAFNLDDAGLERLAKEFEGYQRFFIDKLLVGQIKDKHLIPWNEYVNRRGEKTGRKEDDMLFPPDEEE